MKQFHVSEQRWVWRGDAEQPICPDCIAHQQEDPMNASDCKNEFFMFVLSDGKIKEHTHSQCTCCSMAHGGRR